MRVVLPALLLAVAFGAGCNPSCKRTCRKVLECGNLSTDRLALGACVEDCQKQEQLYDNWDDEAKQDLFVDHKRCLVGATCEEIEEGVCYDGYEDLFSF
jgi:hypothetical protein